MTTIRNWLLATALMFLLPSCGSDETNDPPPAGNPALFVINSLGGTLDVIDLATNEIHLGVLTLGESPNDIAFEPTRNVIYVVNSSSNDVWEVDAAADTVTDVADLGPNTNPWWLTVTEPGQVAVTNWLSGDVVWLNFPGGQVARRRTVGQAPEGVRAHNGNLYVTVTAYESGGTYGTGELVMIDGPRQAVGTNPQDVVVGPDGNLHVICTGDYAGSFGTVHVLDATTLAPIDTISLGGTPAAATVSGNDVYVSGFYGGLVKYDGVTHQIVRGPGDPILSSTGLGKMALDAVEGRLYVPCFDEDVVYVVDVAADTVLTAYAVGDGPVAVALRK
jgi:DNA-binding beta-propeller fold protein YncE